MNVEDEMTRKASEALMRGIDFKILCVTLESGGWNVLKMH
jgi:hypothetical protein